MMFITNKKAKKTVGAIMLFVFVFSNTFFLAPKTVRAIPTESAVTGYLTVTVVGDIPKKWKTGMNIAAYMAAKRLVAEMTRSIVNWINSGFQGDPTFVSNPRDFFLGVANEATGAVIQETVAGQLFCAPYRPQILIALSQTNTYSQRAQCTLLDVVDNVDGFLNDFSQGGWEGWVQLTQNPQGNIYGSYLIAVDEKNRRISQATGYAKSEIGQGQGFRSLKRCKKGTELLGPDVTNSEADLLGPDIADTPLEGNCAESDKEVVTPGVVIFDQLNLALGSPIRQGELADTIGESIATIFDALINQLILTGVRSLSSNGDSGSETFGWYEQGLEDDRTELIDGINSEIDVRKTMLGLNENINAGLVLATKTKACYSEQVATISMPTFFPPNLQVVPTKESIDKKIKTIKEKEKRAEEFKNDGKKDEIMRELEELSGMLKKAETAKTLDDISQITEGLSKFKFGGEGDYEKDYEKYTNRQEDRQIVKDIEKELALIEGELAQCGADLEVLQSYIDAERIAVPVLCVEDSCKNAPQQQQQK